MTMPNRMRGKPIPPKMGILKTCSHCKKRYFTAELVKRGERSIKICPKCKGKVS